MTMTSILKNDNNPGPEAHIALMQFDVWDFKNGLFELQSWCADKPSIVIQIFDELQNEIEERWPAVGNVQPTIVENDTGNSKTIWKTQFREKWPQIFHGKSDAEAEQILEDAYKGDLLKEIDREIAAIERLQLDELDASSVQIIEILLNERVAEDSLAEYIGTFSVENAKHQQNPRAAYHYWSVDGFTHVIKAFDENSSPEGIIKLAHLPDKRIKLICKAVTYEAYQFIHTLADKIESDEFGRKIKRGIDNERENQKIKKKIRNQKRGMNADTLPKLQKLIAVKKENTRNGQVGVSFSKACELAGVDIDTVKNNAPEIQMQWNDPQHLPQYG